MATVAATLGDNLGFALGYYGGRPLLLRYQSLFRIKETSIQRGENLFAKYGATTVFLRASCLGCALSPGRWRVCCGCLGGGFLSLTFSAQWFGYP